MNQVNVIPKPRHSFCFLCANLSRSRAGAVIDEGHRFVVHGATDGPGGAGEGIALTEFDYSPENRQERASEACKFAVRFARGVS
jgi:hypothetical protein